MTQLQAKMMTSMGLARSVLAKVVALPGGMLPVQDCREAVNKLSADCVPVRRPSETFTPGHDVCDALFGGDCVVPTHVPQVPFVPQPCVLQA